MPTAPVQRPAVVPSSGPVITPKPVTLTMPLNQPQRPAASISTTTPQSTTVASQEVPFSLLQVKGVWNKITFAASKRKITVGTYLQAGYPMALDKGRLVIGFSKEHAFHKDCLNSPDAIAHIMGAIEEALGRSCPVDLKLVDEIIDREPTTAIEEALEVFGGEIVNEWHNDSDPK